MMKRSSWEAGEAGLASSSHRWPTQSKLAKMSLAMSPYTSYGSIRVTMKLEVHILVQYKGYNSSGAKKRAAENFLLPSTVLRRYAPY